MHYEKTLVVKDAQRNDVQRDTVRVHWRDRGNFKKGHIVRVTANNKTRPLVMRGLGDNRQGQILMDFIIREEFELKSDGSYKFRFDSVGPWGKLEWARNHSDPSIRIATWVAICAVSIGIILWVGGLLI